MKKIFQLLILSVVCSSISAQSIRLHPDNPHYFLYRGKAIAIISSSEHYGAVLNPEFDYVKYLNTLQKDGMNYTRLFTGSYFEKAGSFGIEFNTLAPAPGKALIPWKRSNEHGALCGGNKFDLDQWDQNYFRRLKTYISEASKRGIIVEVTLFSSIYGYWDTQIWNPANNINIKENLAQADLQTLKDEKIIKYQENFVRKIVKELNEFDNITYEIQNEPWSDHSFEVKNEFDRGTVKAGEEWESKIEIADNLSLEWQKKIASFIVDEEKDLRNKHLIAQNYCNHFYAVPEVDPRVSILNFHYDYPEVVEANFRHPKVTGYDESGFAGSEDSTYRKEAWKFIISGGGLFNNLDYSFTLGHEDGTAVNKAPGGGSNELRKQLMVLSGFLHSFDFIRMKPDKINSENGAVITLSEPGMQYAIYIEKNSISFLKIDLPAGNYKAEWVSPLTGSILKLEQIKHTGGLFSLKCPEFMEDVALRILRLD
jgi:hypothetical protein